MKMIRLALLALLLTGCANSPFQSNRRNWLAHERAELSGGVKFDRAAKPKLAIQTLAAEIEPFACPDKSRGSTRPAQFSQWPAQDRAEYAWMLQDNANGYPPQTYVDAP